MTAPTTDILFFEGFDDLDAVGPLEVLTAAGFPVRAVSYPDEATTVRSAHGLSLALSASLGERPRLLVVPGGGWFDEGPGARALANGSELPTRLAALHAAGTVLASVCTGAMLLATAGLLQGRPAVTNHHALAALAGAGANVRGAARVVDDGDVVTSGGPAAGLDLAVHLVGRFLGPEAGARA
ncbi:MAG: DJ-1/PfpI family protein, partial [Actinomycetota bacterium]|nr:DJ-1/PfpI family protein [Actinomycetota bacterium]